MPQELPIRRVEVSFAGPAPAARVARASGVSEVRADGSVLRCLVCGSFQPFLEALRGHEVLGLDSAAAHSGGTPPAPSSSSVTGTTAGAA